MLTRDDNSSLNDLLKMLREDTNLPFIYVNNWTKKEESLILEGHPKLILFELDSKPLTYSIISHLKNTMFNTPYFIAVTAYFERGIEAFKEGFNDVFINPSPMLEVNEIVKRFEIYQKEKTKIIRLKSFRDYIYLRPEEILYLKADNNTTDIYLNTGEIVGMLQTLKSFEPLLPAQFKRIQKSYIINTTYLYFVNEGKKRCKLLGVTQDFKYSHTYLPLNYRLARTIQLP